MADRFTKIAYLALRCYPHPERPEWYWEEICVQAAPSYEREVVSQSWDDHTVVIWVGRRVGEAKCPTLIAAWLSPAMRVPVVAGPNELPPTGTLLSLLSRQFRGPISPCGAEAAAAPSHPLPTEA